MIVDLQSVQKKDFPVSEGCTDANTLLWPLFPSSLPFLSPRLGEGLHFQQSVDSLQSKLKLVSVELLRH